MTIFNKLQSNVGLKKADDDVIECVSIRGTLVDLRNISPLLRERWRAASRRVGKHEAAKADLSAIGQAILAEQALKIAPRTSGDLAVAAKLMGFKSAK